MKIGIYNTTRLDKTQEEWINNHNYRASGWGNFGFTKDLGLGLFKEKISKEPFQDEPLTPEESRLLKNLLEQKIKNLLVGRIPEEYDFPRIFFLGEYINLNIKPTGLNDQDFIINNLYTAYKICEEYLNENKPVYLSITDGNE